jgi:integrase
MIRVRKWRASDGTLREGYQYDISIKRPGEVEATRYRGAVPGNVTSKRAAEAFERTLVASILDGSYQAAIEAKTAEVNRCPTIEEFAPSYIEASKAIDSSCGEREAKARETTIRRYLAPFFGSTPLDEITTEMISSFVQHMATAPKPKGPPGFSRKSIRNHVAVLTGLLRHATPKHLGSVPRVRWPKVPQPRPRYYTFEQAEALIEASQTEPFWSSMILVALRCGLRIGELMALHWSSVDFRQRVIVVERAFSKLTLKPPKNGRIRTVPMPASVFDALKAHPHRLGSPWVWPSPDGDALRQNEVKCPMWRALKRAGLPRDQWHICRHTFCSHLAMRGVPLQTIMELAGHSSYAMTLRYAHLAPHVHAEAIAKLDEPTSNPTVKETPTATKKARQG